LPRHGGGAPEAHGAAAGQDPQVKDGLVDLDAALSPTCASPRYDEDAIALLQDLLWLRLLHLEQVGSEVLAHRFATAERLRFE
jgi:hypothetical protein